MADFDVAAVGLSVPANPSPLDTYRPAISVRNNGLYAATASGTIQIYKAGRLVFSAAVTSSPIDPGETGLALAASEWTPDEETDYVIYGYVSTPNDQVEPNNNLQPSTVAISGAPPPPPVVVPAHALQHRDGGSDELSVEGLPGKLADDQTAEAHVASHQVGGSDQLSLAGLSGQAAEAQPPDIHGNAAHNPDMASQAELTTHANGTLRHDAATNLANRETSGDQVGLVKQIQLGDASEVPLAGQDANRLGLLREVVGFPATGRLWGFPWPTDHASMHNPGGRDPIGAAFAVGHVPDTFSSAPGSPIVQILRLDLSPDQVRGNVVLSADFAGEITTDLALTHTAHIYLRIHSTSSTDNVAVANISLAKNKTFAFACRIAGGIRQPLNKYAHGLITMHAVDSALASSDEHTIATNPAGGVLIGDATNFYFEVLIGWSVGGVGNLFDVHSAAGLIVIP